MANTTTEIETIKDSLRKRIVNHGLSITIVAKWANYNPCHVSKVFRGEINTSKNMLNALDSALNKYEEFINKLQ